MNQHHRPPLACLYSRLVQRSVSSLDPASSAFPRMDWRFSEFPNCGAHALYVTCVELMTVPEQPAVIGEKLLEVFEQLRHLTIHLKF